MSYLFCGAKITQIKHLLNNIPDKIVISTCYFHNSELFFNKYNGRQLEYINGLISNIETFQMKINKFTSNPEKWVYRVYIDETVLNISSLMHNVLGINKLDILEAEKLEHNNSKSAKKQKNIWYMKNLKKTLKNKSNNNIINELDPKFTELKNNIAVNYNIFIFIETLLKKYINRITSSEYKSKYSNIEIFTYSNPKLQYKLLSDPNKLVSGEIATYGTLMRYHPLIDKSISVVIMRNCSHNITPLDLIIQNYWILEEQDMEYMEYVDKTYDFTEDRDLVGRKNWYMSLYHKSTNSKHTMASKIRHFGYDRVMAGMISCKTNKNTFHSSSYYKEIFNKLYMKLQFDNPYENIYYFNYASITYDYGIDEALINFIFPELRITTYRNSIKEDNPKNTIQKTFAINIINGSITTCGKCNKKSLMKLINSKYQINNKDKDIETNNNVMNKFTNKMENKYKNKCCLHEIYKFNDDTKTYHNKPVWLNYRMLYNLPWELDYLNSLPFYSLNINTWQIPKLSFTTVLKSIMYKNNYIFALKNGTYNIPNFIRKTKTIIHTKISNSKSISKSISKSSSKSSSKSKTHRKIDKYLVLCNVKKTDTETDKYISYLDKAYNSDNFYPVLLYPSHITLLRYLQNKTISFKKIIKPLQNKHGFTFN